MLKFLIPKSLFARFILIIMVPTILTQIIATYIFYNRHWLNVSNHMVGALTGEISSIVTIHETISDPELRAKLAQRLNLGVDFDSTTHDLLKIMHPESLENLSENLKSSIRYPYTLEYTTNDMEIKTSIKINNGILSIIASKKRIENPTTNIFIFWMTGTSAFFFLLSLIFSRNQIRPIIRLARFAEYFGKGIAINNFKPEGALEVRKATIAFLKMKERIERQISQRTELLTGVSHDLRTPLTRLKLELAMSSDPAAKDMEEDVNEMERMINSYLEFARGEGSEKSHLLSIENLISKIVKKYKKFDKHIEYHFRKRTYIYLKEQAMNRVISNLLDNAFKFAQKVTINLDVEEQYIQIFIEDDGPGISENEIDNVFRPFYRIEGSRNTETGGVGLGLSLVRDIINSHGGQVDLSRSEKLGGLKVILKLPR